MKANNEAMNMVMLEKVLVNLPTLVKNKAKIGAWDNELQVLYNMASISTSAPCFTTSLNIVQMFPVVRLA